MKIRRTILTILVLAVVAYFAYQDYISTAARPDDVDHERTPAVLQDGDFSLHFLELGNKAIGDSVYIKNGDIDILIDAGSIRSSAQTITTYVDQYIDGELDYVIATHADQDHIAGFVGTNSVEGILEYYEIGTIIDFPRTEKTTDIKNDYVAARDAAVAKGAEHYTALECFDAGEATEGARRTFDLGGGVSMEILYNYYYEHDADIENDYSVCVMFSDADGNQYLFTGDLEDTGEAELVDFYESGEGRSIKPNGLGECLLYKGGHHGSSTSGTDKLLNEIKPEYICICTCAGSDQYKGDPFPTQEFLTRALKHTDKIYVTSIIRNDELHSLNGNITFIMRASIGQVHCDYDNTKLKDTTWFKENRTA
jgi:beta-lactamase superfamily II metal-dependent hydrolase